MTAWKNSRILVCLLAVLIVPFHMCWRKGICVLVSLGFAIDYTLGLAMGRPHSSTSTDKGSTSDASCYKERAVVHQPTRRDFFVRASVVTGALLIATSSSIVSPVYAASATSSTLPPPRRRSSSSSSPLSSLFPNFQFDTVADVPKSYFTEQRSVYALVERVIDGDTIRVSHVPWYKLTQRAPSPLTSRGIAEQTMSIRFYGVDCPETAKYGQAGQPYSEEATVFTTDMLLHKMVKITFLRRDQYGRAISAVETVSPWWALGLRRKDVSVELAKAGLAELYTGGGAEYFGKRATLEKNIAQAQNKSLGIWSQGRRRTSAADFKKKTNGVPAVSENNTKKNKQKTVAGKNVLKNSNTQNKRATPALTSSNKRKTTLLDAAITGLEMAV